MWLRCRCGRACFSKWVMKSTGSDQLRVQSRKDLTLQVLKLTFKMGSRQSTLRLLLPLQSLPLHASAWYTIGAPFITLCLKETCWSNQVALREGALQATIYTETSLLISLPNLLVSTFHFGCQSWCLRSADALDLLMWAGLGQYWQKLPDNNLWFSTQQFLCPQAFLHKWQAFLQWNYKKHSYISFGIQAHLVNQTYFSTEAVGMLDITYRKTRQICWGTWHSHHYIIYPTENSRS